MFICHLYFSFNQNCMSVSKPSSAFFIDKIKAECLWNCKILYLDLVALWFYLDPNSFIELIKISFGVSNLFSIDRKHPTQCSQSDQRFPAGFLRAMFLSYLTSEDSYLQLGLCVNAFRFCGFVDFHKEAKELDNSNITGSGHLLLWTYNNLLIMRVSCIISKIT